MIVTASHSAPSRIRNACLVAAVFNNGTLASTAASLQKSTRDAIDRAIARGDITGKSGDTLMLHEVDGLDAERLLLLGVGDPGPMHERDFRLLASRLPAALSASGTVNAVIGLVRDIDVSDRDAAWQCRQIALALHNSQYRFTLHTAGSAGKRRGKADAPALKKAVLLVDKADARSCSAAAREAQAIGTGMSLTRDLGNLAPNICTPSHLANEARRLARKHPALTARIVEEATMKKLGMGAFLAVSRGSRQPAKLICMEYKGGKSGEAPVVIVGKGVTFDTGGISIKPSAAMDEMKYDMCGAASVFGTISACCEFGLKRNVIGVVAAAENMPDGDASRPGDVVTTMSGQTVEILNTDAEGRLVLCDTLTYVQRYKPELIIDVATLTGACIIALGHVASAVMANDQPLADALLEAGRVSGDYGWQLPLWEEYQSQLDSNFADIANIGGRPAGSITAGCFLARFAEKQRWAHLDIAGVAWKSGSEKGASGRPVPMLMQFLLDASPAGSK